MRSCGTFQCGVRRVQGNVVCVTEVGDVEAAEAVVRNLADATQEEFLRRVVSFMENDIKNLAKTEMAYSQKSP